MMDGVDELDGDGVMDDANGRDDDLVYHWHLDQSKDHFVQSDKVDLDGDDGDGDGVPMQLELQPRRGNFVCEESAYQRTNFYQSIQESDWMNIDAPNQLP